MLFKRFIEGKSVLKPISRSRDLTDPAAKKIQQCHRRRSECVLEFCAEHSTLIEETVKMAIFGFMLWAGLTLGSLVTPYPLSLIVSTDFMHPPPMYDFPFPSPEMLKRLPHIRAKHTNQSIALSKMTVDMLSRLEDNLKASGINAGQGTPAKGLLVHSLPSEEAMHYEKSSMIISKASQNLVATRCTRFGLRHDECASFISTLNLGESEFGAECASLERFSCSNAKKVSRYRSFDGSCNNPFRSSWGQALTGYKRLLHPKYADGIEEPRRASSGQQLPSARLVSTKLTSEIDKPDDSKTLMLAVWSQFVQHDLTYTPVKKTIHSGEAIRCCDKSGFPLAPRYRHPSCMHITVPGNDPYFGKQYVTCMEYTRSVTTYRGDCTFGAAEQMNQASHFLDGSHIYGTTVQDAAALRQSSGGLLKTDSLNDGELLPLADQPNEKCLLSENETVCFQAGDQRANMHPWLSALHTVFVREHNRVARELATLNPGWSNDRLYHEARRFVIALIQHITYKHWLPKLTGQSFEDMYESYDTGYNQDVDPTVTNSFATAAFHFVNSMLEGEVHLLEKDNTVSQSMELMKHFYRPAVLRQEGAVEKIIRGMIHERSQGMDFYYANDMTSGWLGSLDALAVDVQRGRDHGLPAYHLYRTQCGLQQATTFQHFSDVMPQEVIEKLKVLYSDAHDVDLVVGAMAERPEEGSLFGPTFTCLIKEQLWRTRAGDRFFYSHTEEAVGFSKSQLQEVRRASLARVLCDNVPQLKSVRRDVFTPQSQQNPQVSCDEVKRVSLDAWQDPAVQPDLITRTRSNVKKWIRTRVSG